MTRNSIYMILILSLSLMASIGCTSQTSVSTDPEVSEMLPPYDGPKARVSVANFIWKAGGQSGGSIRVDGPYGSYTVTTEQHGYLSGLEDMLISAMQQSKRFSVLERQNLDEIKEEVYLGEDGWVEEESSVKRGKIKGADLQVVAAITGWAPGTKKKSVGIGALLPSALAGARVGWTESAMAMDIRIYDTSTSEILVTKTVRAKARDMDFSGGALGWMGGMPMAGGLSEYSNTPMEKVIRICIIEAVKKLAENTPREYMAY